MGLTTETHEVTVIRENDDDSETLIKCIVQVTLEGSEHTRWRFAGIDFADAGELPDGEMTDLNIFEREQLAYAAAEIRIMTLANIEEAAQGYDDGDY